MQSKRALLFGMVLVLTIAGSILVGRPWGDVSTHSGVVPAREGPAHGGALVADVEAPPAEPMRKGALTHQPSIVSHALRVFVQDNLGLPIPRARVDLLRNDRAENVGVTQDDGYAELRIDVSTDEDLMVSAHSYATSFVSPDAWAGRREVRVGLGPAGQISGVIRDLQEVSVGPDVKVVAVPLVYFQDRALSAREGNRCASGFSALTGHDGSFVLDGLTTGVAYKLEVVSDRFVTLDTGRATRIVASAAGVAVTVYEVYGVLLTFHSEDEQYLAAHFVSPPSTTRHRMGGVFRRLAFWDSSVGVTRGVLREVDLGRYCLPVLFALSARGDYGERAVEYPATIPGFETVIERLHLEPLRAGSMAVQAIELIPNAAGFGSIKLRFTGKCAALLREGNPSARLRLQGREGGQKFSYPLALGEEGPGVMVSGVPSGVYSWELSVGAGWVEFAGTGDGASSLVSLEPGGVSVIDVAVDDIAYVEFECHDANGPVVADLLVANGPYFTNGGANRLRSITCLGASYRFGPLAPGHYEVMAEYPVALPDEVRVFTLEPGQVHVEVFVFP